MTARKGEEGTRSGSLSSCQSAVFRGSVVRSVVKPPGSRINKGVYLNKVLAVKLFAAVHWCLLTVKKSAFMRVR